MRSAVWRNDGTLDVVEVDTPDPPAGWVRIRVASVGICGTDLHFFRGSFPSPEGIVPGHEIGGTIDALGAGIANPALTAGTAVGVEPLVGCGTCPSCSEGQYNRCPQRILFGVGGRGGLAEFVCVPERCVHPLPSGLTPADGALLEPMAVVARGIVAANITPGSRVAVLGTGTIGLLSVLVLRSMGVSTEFTSRHPAQRERAIALGATELSGTDFDAVIETVGGRADTLNEAVSIVRPGGTIVVLGVFAGNAKLNALSASFKEITLRAINCYSHSHGHSDFSTATRLLDGHISTVRTLVTNQFRLSEVNDAFQAASDKSTGSIKVLISP